MAENIVRHLTHIKSKVVESGLPKLPTSLQIKEGEIAINYAKNNELLSIKNESGDVVTFETKQIHVGVCATNGAVNKKVVSVDGPFVLKKGSTVAVKFNDSNTATGVTLNVNNTGDKSIYYADEVYTSSSTTVCGQTNRIITYLYDGTYWVWQSSGEDENTKYTVVDNSYAKYNNMLAANDIYRYQILVSKDENYLLPINTVNNNTGTSKTLTTEEFDPFGGIYYYSSTITTTANSNITIGRAYQEILADLRFSFNIGSTLTAGRSVYLVVEPQSNGKVKLHSNPISQTLPSTSDGLVYIRLGNAYDTYKVQLEIPHSAYEYKNGQIRQYVGASEMPNNGAFSISGNGTVAAATSANASADTGLNIKAGSNIAISVSDGEITINGTSSSSYASGTSAEISAGVDTTQKVWNALNLNDGIEALIDAKLGSGFTGANSGNTVTKVIEDNEETVSAAINDLKEDKADIDIAITASSGLTGGGDLSGDISIALETTGTPGTYYQVVVDEYGRVTSGSTEGGGGGGGDLSEVTETISASLNDLDDRVNEAEKYFSELDFYTGFTSYTAITYIPVEKSLVIVDPQAIFNGFSIIGDYLPAGYEMRIIIRNNNTDSTSYTINIGSFISGSSIYRLMGNSTLTIPAGQAGEINVISDGETLYVKV